MDPRIERLKADFREYARGKWIFFPFVRRKRIRILSWSPICNDTQVLCRIRGYKNRDKCMEWFQNRPEVGDVEGKSLTIRGCHNEVMLHILLSERIKD